MELEHKTEEQIHVDRTYFKIGNPESEQNKPEPQKNKDNKLQELYDAMQLKDKLANEQKLQKLKKAFEDYLKKKEQQAKEKSEAGESNEQENSDEQSGEQNGEGQDSNEEGQEGSGMSSSSGEPSGKEGMGTIISISKGDGSKDGEEIDLDIDFDSDDSEETEEKSDSKKSKRSKEKSEDNPEDSSDKETNEELDPSEDSLPISNDASSEVIITSKDFTKGTGDTGTGTDIVKEVDSKTILVAKKKRFR